MTPMQEEEKKKNSAMQHFLHEIGAHLGFLQLVIAAALTVHIASSKPMTELAAWLETEYPVPKAFAYTNYGYHTDFLFGPQAVIACINKCNPLSYNNKEICKRRCHKLSLAEYAHRINLAENNPQNDYETILSLCSKEKRFPLANSLESWFANIKSGYSLLKHSSVNTSHFGQNRYFYENAIKVLSEMTVTKGNQNSEFNNLTKMIYKANCLYAHQALCHLGSIMSKQNEDPYSQKHYEELTKFIANSANKLSPEIINKLEIFADKLNLENEDHY